MSERREADKELAGASWRAAAYGGAPLWAALGMFVLFTIRAHACSDESLKVPDTVDFKWYGEHCGPGHGTDGEPIDELDAACKRHDEAYRRAQAND